MLLKHVPCACCENHLNYPGATRAFASHNKLTMYTSQGVQVILWVDVWVHLSGLVALYKPAARTRVPLPQGLQAR